MSVEGPASEAEAHLRALAPDLKVRLAPPERSLKLDSWMLSAEGARLWKNSYSASVEFSSEEPPDELVLFKPVAGFFQSLTQQTELAGPGQLLCRFSTRPSVWRLSDNTIIEGMSLPRNLILARLEILLGGRSKQKLEFQPLLDTQTSGVQAVRAVAQAIAAAALTGKLNLEGGIIRNLSSTLIDLVLAAVPNSHTEALQRPPARIGPRQVRRAIAYIHDNPMPVLTTDELANICGVGVRSLQYTFRDFVGMAPAEYWRNVRLERALEHLRRHPSESVSSVAAAWGFANVTRFRALAAGLP